MKKNIGKVIFSIIIVAAVFLGLSSLVITKENEYKVIRQFGKINHVQTEAGVSFKIPFLQTEATLPKCILVYDLSPSDVITQDKKTMITDSYVLWQITDPIKFAQTLNSSITNAEGRINTVVYNSIKNIISSLPQEEVISGRDGGLSEAIMENVGNKFQQYGLEVVAVETKQLDLPNDNKEAVYERMISERGNIAATYTAEGAAEAQKIRNTTDKEVSILISEANKQSEILKAEGEAEYMKILSEAYKEESRSDFYSFVRSLDALKESMKGNNKKIILDKDSPIAQIFYGGN
ncbi:MAG: protease modulator HflC [Lachnospiraceae bacterium]|nr:protease modulator HflC [Lachnospiraceae bacterium]